MNKKVQILCYMLVFLCGQLWAYEEPVKETLEQKAIETNIEISEWFDSVAEGLDLFLVGKKVTTRKNETSVKLENSTFMTEGGGLKNETGVGINLRLPNVEDYWFLKFSSYDEKEESKANQKGYSRRTPRKQTSGATVGLFKRLGDIRTSFEPRIELNDPLRISHYLDFESVIELKTYNINPKIELFATPDKGTGIYFAFNLNWELSSIFSFTLINNGEYEEKRHYYSSTHGFSFGQIVNEECSLAYSLVSNSNNKTNYHLDAYSFAVTWSQQLYKNILNYQIIPHWDFVEEKGFKGVTGLILNININF